MDISSDIREFLVSRRARITPEQAGLPVYGGRRRVTGLRREEVALLAGISVEYYTRLERGNAAGVSEEVLDGIVRALQLDEAERAHLLDLVHTAGPARTRTRKPASERVRPAVQRMLDAINSPAYVRNGRLDILAANRLGQALYSEVLDDPIQPANTARFLFLDPRGPRFFVNWNQHASDVVAVLRAEAGRDPYDKALSDLIGLLSTRSEEFRVRWAAHNVKQHRAGTKTLHHPIAGDITLAYEALEVAADPGQRLLVYTAEPGSPDQEALDLLASWTAPDRQSAETEEEPWRS